MYVCICKIWLQFAPQWLVQEIQELFTIFIPLQYRKRYYIYTSGFLNQANLLIFAAFLNLHFNNPACYRASGSIYFSLFHVLNMTVSCITYTPIFHYLWYFYWSLFVIAVFLFLTVASLFFLLFWLLNSKVLCTINS